MGIRLTRMEKALTVALAILFVIPPGFAQTVLQERRPVTVSRDRKPVIRDREALSPDSTVNVDVDLDLRVLPDDYSRSLSLNNQIYLSIICLSKFTFRKTSTQ